MRAWFHCTADIWAVFLPLQYHWISIFNGKSRDELATPFPMTSSIYFWAPVLIQSLDVNSHPRPIAPFHRRPPVSSSQPKIHFQFLEICFLIFRSYVSTKSTEASGTMSNSTVPSTLSTPRSRRAWLRITMLLSAI